MKGKYDKRLVDAVHKRRNNTQAGQLLESRWTSADAWQTELGRRKLSAREIEALHL